MSEIDPRLLKIVALAKFGSPGERDNAAVLLHRLCDRLSVDFDEVMGGDEQTHEYTLYFKTIAESDILSQLVRNFLQVDEIKWNKWRKVIFLETTAAKYIEVRYAAEIYLAAFRKERRRVLADLPGAFVIKNSLFGPGPGKDISELTNQQIAAAYRKRQLAEGMERVKIHKAIGDGK